MSHLAVRGLINLRGQIVTVIDLRRCLELAERPTGQLPVNLIVYTDDGCVSLLVDQVGDVLSVDEDQFEYPPATLQGRSRDLIRGAYKLEGKLMLVLDTDKVVEATSGSAEKDGHGSVPAANKSSLLKSRSFSGRLDTSPPERCAPPLDCLCEGSVSEETNNSSLDADATSPETSAVPSRRIKGFADFHMRPAALTVTS